MKKVLVISDSFKGTLESGRIAAVAAEQIRAVMPQCRVLGFPVADGGEGTVDCFLQALGGERVCVDVTGPWDEPVTAAYARIGDTAVVEMAAAAGLPQVGTRLDPSHTTTWGVGQLMRHALEHGAKKLILGLGGSATNDGGCGAAAALGVRFLNAAGAELRPVGATLQDIAHVDCAKAKALLAGAAVEVMCDIDNPLCGARGAAAVFGPQKGADAAMIARLDAGLRHLADVLERDLGVSVADVPGAGAAGGFGAGAAAFFGAQLRPGIEVVLDMIGFEKELDGCDLVITGEGRIDGQSLGGKVPVGVARRARKHGVPVVAIVGVEGDGAEAVYDAGVTAIFPTNRAGLPFAQLAPRAERDYARTVADVMRFAAAMRG